MFFIMGISTGQKKLDFNQTILCTACGNFGRYEVFVTYTYLSLFFIPIFKWGRKYYVKNTCCNSTYAIEEILGRKIASGECSSLSESDLHLVRKGNICPACGFELQEGFQFCPKCGQQL